MSSVSRLVTASISLDSGDVTTVEAVPCDEPHDNEVYDKFDLEGDDFPGAAEVQQQGQEACLGERFEQYVGVSYQQSIYGAGPITSSEQTWEERG